MEQVDLTWALLGLKEMCFWRCLAARKVLLQEQRLRQEGTAGTHIEVLRICPCGHQLQCLFITPSMAFLQALG